MRKHVASLLILAAVLSGTLLAADGQKVSGNWSKVYFEQDGRKDSDSRWSVDVSFLDDGTFLWKSVSLQEVWIEKNTGERRTEVRKEELELKGRYSISGEFITFTFLPTPEGEAATLASLNLGYDTGKKQGNMTFKLEKDNLILSVISGAKRTFAFTNKERSSNKPDAVDGK
ncbi:MAG: hypothetical protein ACOYLM_13135 [Methylococcaceae bacterium]